MGATASASQISTTAFAIMPALLLAEGGAEWESMVDVEIAVATLDNKPRLVGREHRARAMKFCNIQSARLSAWRRKGNLNGGYECISMGVRCKGQINDVWQMNSQHNAYEINDEPRHIARERQGISHLRCMSPRIMRRAARRPCGETSGRPIAWQ